MHFFHNIFDNLRLQGFSLEALLLSCSLFSFLVGKILSFVLSRLNKKNTDHWGEMNVRINSINQHYTGRKKYLQIKYLHQKHDFGFMDRFYSAAPILCQLPILIFMYIVLAKYKGFLGESFLAIKSLSQPDRLFYGYSVLPFLMFFMSTFPVYIVENKNLQAQKKTILSISLFFLFVVYSQPAALLMYWVGTTFLNSLNLIWKYKDDLSFSVFSRSISDFILRINDLRNRGGLLPILFLVLVKLSFFVPLESFSHHSFFIIAACSLFFFVNTQKRNFWTPIVCLALISIDVYTEILPRGFSLLSLLLLKNNSLYFPTPSRDFKSQIYLLSTLCLFPLQYISKNLNYFNFEIGIFFLATVMISFFVIRYTCRLLSDSSLNLEKATILSTSYLVAFLALPELTREVSLNAETNSLLFFVGWAMFYVSYSYFYKFNINSKRTIGIIVILVSLVTFIDKYKIQLKKNNRKSSVHSDFKNLSFDKKPNIYFLIYDAYQSHKVYKELYGIDNLKLENYLTERKFTVFNDVYSAGSSSASSMKRVLGLNNNNISATHKILQFNDYETYYVFDSYFQKNGFLFKGAEGYFPEYNRYDGFLTILSGLRIGEFKFNTKSIFLKSTEESRHEKLLSYISLPSQKSKFIYSHSPLPLHSQNSGVCRDNETQLFKNRLDKANVRLKSIVQAIDQEDPESVTIIIGDHGPYLLGDCYKMNNSNINSVSRKEILDRYGTFTAIRWPKSWQEKPESPVIIQNLLVDLFAKLSQQPSLVRHKFPITSLDMPILPCRGKAGSIFKDGIIQCGKDKGQPLILPASLQ